MTDPTQPVEPSPPAQQPMPADLPAAPLPAAPPDPSTIVREYGGATPEEAAAAYTREATILVGSGYLVAAQAWTPQRTLVVTYQLSGAAAPATSTVAPDQPASPAAWAAPVASATAAPSAAPAPTAGAWAPPPEAPARVDRYCTRCGKFQSPAWTMRCEHCGAPYAEFPPATTPPPPGYVPAASGRSRTTTLVIVAVIVVFVLLLAITLLAVGLQADLSDTLNSI